MEIKLRDIAALVKGVVEGDPDLIITRPSKIEEGGAGSITFLGNPKYEAFAYTTTASALIVSQDFQPKQPINASFVRVPDVYVAVATLMGKFSHDQGNLPVGIADDAVIHPSATLGKQVSVGMYSVIEQEVKLGDNCRIYPQVFIGRRVQIGPNCIIHPGVRILQDTIIGANCIIHPNVVIGGDGFGFAPDETGVFTKIPQLGNVVIGDDVEIGSNATIDRASMGSTRIGKGVKIDNLVQIAHNVEIGDNTVIAALTGIAGSAKIGKNCMIGGQVGVAGHITVANGTKVQAQTGLASTVKEENTILCGYPAFAYADFLRAQVIFKQLPQLHKRIQALERQLNQPPDPS